MKTRMIRLVLCAAALGAAAGAEGEAKAFRTVARCAGVHCGRPTVQEDISEERPEGMDGRRL